MCIHTARICNGRKLTQSIKPKKKKQKKTGHTQVEDEVVEGVEGIEGIEDAMGEELILGETALLRAGTSAVHQHC